MKNLNSMDWLVLALVIIGGLNWGLIGIFNFDLVAAIFGEMSALSRIIYSLVGISSVTLIFIATRLQKKGIS